MGHELTPELRMLTDSMSRFLAQHYDVLDLGRGRVNEVEPDKTRWRQFTELGVIHALFSESEGGMGGGAIDIQAVFECLGRHLVREPFQDALIVGHAIAAGGRQIHQSLLAQLISGDHVGVLAHDELYGHYQLSRVGMSATRNVEGWVLKGTKLLVSNAAMADFFLVSARIEGSFDSEDGIGLFVVERHASGLSYNHYQGIDGEQLSALTFDSVEVSDDAIVCNADQGYVVLEYGVARGLLAVCSEALGLLEAIKDQTLDYLCTRRQFGKPLGKFQALQHRMADIAIDIEQARSAVMNAAQALSEDRQQRERTLSAAKYTVGTTSVRVAEECLQFMGAIGMTWELPLSHYAKRLVMIDHRLGDVDHHLERYIEFTHKQQND